MENGGTKAAMVACGLISLRKEIVAEARRGIGASTGRRGDQVILSATHCHAGPQMHPLFLALSPEPARRLGEAVTPQTIWRRTLHDCWRIRSRVAVRAQPVAIASGLAIAFRNAETVASAPQPSGCRINRLPVYHGACDAKPDRHALPSRASLAPGQPDCTGPPAGSNSYPNWDNGAMSDRVLRLIPNDPQFEPLEQAAAAAVRSLETMMPAAVEFRMSGFTTKRVERLSKWPSLRGTRCGSS